MAIGSMMPLQKMFETLSLSLATYRHDLNLDAGDFEPQPTRIVPAATRRAILVAHTYRRIFAKYSSTPSY